MALLDTDFESDPRAEEILEELDKLFAQFPELVDPIEHQARRADVPADMAATFLRRWNLSWDQTVQRPDSPAALKSLLDTATATGLALRVVGAARSHSKVCEPLGTGIKALKPLSLIALASELPFTGASWHALPRTDPFEGTTKLYRCQAGRPVRKVLDDLEASNRSLANHGSGSFQGIVGLIATGSHGSGWQLPPLSGLVRAVTVLIPDGPGASHFELILPADSRKPYEVAHGAVVKMRFGDEEHDVRVNVDTAVFDATNIGLGSLGLIYSVTLEVIDHKMYLREARTLRSWNLDVRDHFEEEVDKSRHFEVQIIPHHGTGAAGGVDIQPSDHLCQVVTRKISSVERRTGRRGLPLRAGRLGIAKTIIGMRIRKGLRDPTRLPNGLVNAITQTADRDFHDYIAEVLLMELQFVGIGAEFAVPLSKARSAADWILTQARDHDARARAIINGGFSSSQQQTKLEVLWRENPPLTAIITLRFSQEDSGTLSMTNPANRTHEARSGIWCIFEIGMLGAPVLEEQLKEPPSSADSDLLRLYRAYDDGRRAFLHEVQAELTQATYGGRPHWGLINNTTAAEASRMWGAANWNAWKSRYDEVNVNGVFNGRYTDQLGISVAGGPTIEARGPCFVRPAPFQDRFYLKLKGDLAWHVHNSLSRDQARSGFKVGDHILSSVSTFDPVVCEIRFGEDGGIDPPHANGKMFHALTERIPGEALLSAGTITITGEAGERLAELICEARGLTPVSDIVVLEVVNLAMGKLKITTPAL